MQFGSTMPPEIAWQESYKGNGFVNSVFGCDACKDGGLIIGENNERINGDYMAIKINYPVNINIGNTNYFGVIFSILLCLLTGIICLVVYKKKRGRSVN